LTLPRPVLRFLRKGFAPLLAVTLVTACGGKSGESHSAAVTQTSSGTAAATAPLAAALSVKTGEMLNAITYGNGTFVAVGDLGKILTSVDGTVWAPHPAATDSSLLGVAFGQGRFIAVGASGAILSSDDGTTWDAAESGTEEYLFSAAFGNGAFVTIGSGGTMLHSTDGASWRGVGGITGGNIYNVSFCKDRFIAVAEGGIILTSADGATWTATHQALKRPSFRQHTAMAPL
jgi:hypothetical protein